MLFYIVFVDFYSSLMKWKANHLVVYLRAVGGESASPAALAPKVGPLGMVIRPLDSVLAYRLPRRLVMIFKRLPWIGRVLRSPSS